MNIEHLRIKVGQHELAATLAGPPDARMVVLVHGLGVSRRYFRPLVEQLSQSCRVVSLDLPGFGDSSRPRHALDVSELADVVARTMTQQRWRNAVLVGQSMGCQIVSRLVIRYPGLASQIVLISPTAYDRERTAWMQALRLFQDTLREPASANAVVFYDYLRCGIPRYRQTLRHMLADRIEDRLTSCPVPCLIVRGERDPIVPRDWARRLAALAPHGALVEILNAPHLAQYSHAPQIAHICLRQAGLAGA